MTRSRRRRARADATDDDSEDEAASESEEAPDPWTDDGEYVVCLGCPEATDDGFVSSGRRRAFWSVGRRTTVLPRRWRPNESARTSPRRTSEMSEERLV